MRGSILLRRQAAKVVAAVAKRRALSSALLLGASASATFASGGDTDTVTWPTGLGAQAFVNNLLTQNASAITAGAVLITGLTVLMYVRKGFGRKAGQTAGR